MSNLHTLNRSPGSGLLLSAGALLSPGDALLFIEDGIYYCDQTKELAELPADIVLYALKEDLLARGMKDHRETHITLVDYSRFVELCCEFDKVINWF